MTTHAPASFHHASLSAHDTLGQYANQHAQQYTLATRLGNVERERGRSRRPRSRSPAGLVGSSASALGAGFGYGQRGQKTVNTDDTRYRNTSSFRGTTPPQRLRYIYRPAGADDDGSVQFAPRSDGRYRSWEEVPYDAPTRPRPYRDEEGREWLPVLSRDANETEWARWEARERRRVAALEAHEREQQRRDRERFHGDSDSARAAHERRWAETQSRAHIHPWFLSGRNRDGSSQLLTPTGGRAMTLLDPTLPWSERQYHHVGRDPEANYATIFSGLEAAQAEHRQRSAEELAREKEHHRHLRKEHRDFERARRKEEKLRMRYELEVAKLEAEQAAARASAGTTKVVKKVIHHADGRDEVVFVKKHVPAGGGAERSNSRPRSAVSAPKPVHAPWGASVAAQRNASRISSAQAAIGHALSPNAQHALSILTPAERRALGLEGGAAGKGRSSRASQGGWLNPATRAQATQQQQQQHQNRRSRSDDSRSRSRSRSRSTSSSRRRAARRAEKQARREQREEEKRKRRNLQANSASVQAGEGTLPSSAAHPRASELEAHLLRQAEERKDMSLRNLGATLGSLDRLTLGGVGQARARDNDGKRAERGAGSSDDSSSVSGDGTSSAFSSSDSSDEEDRSRSPRSRRHHRRHGHKHSRSRSHSRSSAGSSRSRSRSSSVSSSSSHGGRRENKKKHGSRKSKRSKSTGGGSSEKRDGSGWHRRGSFEDMDARVRRQGEERWLRDWERRYAKARTPGQKRELKEERAAWKARRKQHHTLIMNKQPPNPLDAYLLSPSSSTNGAAAPSPSSSSNNHNGVLTDQYGTPIASYGTVYPQPSGTLLQQASMLEQYAASAAYTGKLLAESTAAVEASVGGIENIVDGLRQGYATKGLDAAQQKEQERALQLSLRAAIRAREDRRKKAAALTRANNHVLDELRRQESVIMARGQDVTDSVARTAYEQAMQAQQALELQAQLDAQRARRQALGSFGSGGGGRGGGRGRGGPADGTIDLDGSRGLLRGANDQLGSVQVTDPYWYEKAGVEFSPQHVDYNEQLRRQLGRLRNASP
jgi:hypothetical protein